MDLQGWYHSCRECAKLSTHRVCEQLVTTPRTWSDADRPLVMMTPRNLKDGEYQAQVESNLTLPSCVHKHDFCRLLSLLHQVVPELIVPTFQHGQSQRTATLWSLPEWWGILCRLQTYKVHCLASARRDHSHCWRIKSSQVNELTW